MDDQYELYCLADPLFYDTLDGRRGDHPDFALAARDVPDGWQHQATDTWMHYAPLSGKVPAQGWKIHVSARAEDAERAIEAVWDYCVPRDLAFKFLRSLPVMTMLNSKAAPRGASGKLVTIYPVDEAQLELTLKELDKMLTGVEGPYILSDLRYGEGPLFVRYGGFAGRRCLADNGELVLAVEDGEGRLVPDVREPAFGVPSWVTLPAFLEPHMAARNAVTTEGLPYRVESVIQFSNGGGVYLGEDLRTGRRVVLKEARPHAGLDAVGRDAVARLAHERDMLERLSGLDAVPALIDYFTLGGHHFLVEEFVDGNPLQRQLVHKYPLTRATCDDEALAEYTAWVLDTLPKVRRAVESLHGRGVVFGDLHPNNILMTADGRLTLIDYEVATLTADRGRAALAHPAFCAPADRQGVDVDLHALACLCLGLFAPQLTIMLPLDRAKVTDLGRLILRTFPVPRQVIDEAVLTVTGPGPVTAVPAPRPGAAPTPIPRPGRDGWPALREAMTRAILASATPGRDDRLFPGDVAQFQPGGGVNLAYGAAGVLYALERAGAERLPEHEDWLRGKALAPAPGTGIGFYDGLHGVAYVLDLLGHRQDAIDTVDLCLRQKWESLELGLFGGLAGMGLNLLHLGHTTGERGFTDVALEIAGICSDRLGGPADVPKVSGGGHPRAGLMYGSSGPALLFLHAYERTGDAALLDRAAAALRQDLRRCVTGEDGTLQVDQGWRTLPYLDEGSVGVGMVLARYLAHRDDEGFRAALDGCRRVTRGRYFVQSGLFTGRSGMIAAFGWGLGAEPPTPGTRPTDRSPAGHRTDHHVPSGNRTDHTDLAEQLRGLEWHALPYGGGLAFPGNQLLRLSMDFATGTAGVLFAMSAVLHDRPVFLPFIEPPDGTSVPAGAFAHGSNGRFGSCDSSKEV